MQNMTNAFMAVSTIWHINVATDMYGNGEIVEDWQDKLSGSTKGPRGPGRSHGLSHGTFREGAPAIGEAVQQYIEANYSLDRVMHRWEAFYLEHLGLKGIDTCVSCL